MKKMIQIIREDWRYIALLIACAYMVSRLSFFQS